jgi:uncharacterized membrane protein YagU involved in acid resistance
MTQETIVAGKPLRPLLWAGLLCGVLDLSAAFIQYGIRGIPPARIAQSIAAGLLGRAAYQGGTGSAALGVALHFAIAIIAAAVYYFASRKLPALIRRPILAGVLYGIAVYFFMNYIVLPLSRFPPGRFNLQALLIGLLIHVICVGLPISLVVAHYARGAPASPTIDMKARL